MKKVILYFLMLLISTSAVSQKITLNDLHSFASKTTDEVAESLLNKGFQLNAYPLGKSFSIEAGQESLSVDFKDNDPYYTYKFVRLCYSAKFNKDFETIVNQIKSKGQKKNFFFASSSYRIYLTEYQIGANLYIYVGRGLCESLDHKYKYGSLIVSNISILEKLR
jgi:hypothetical protein